MNRTKPRGVRVVASNTKEIRTLALSTRKALGLVEPWIDVIRLLEHQLPEFNVHYDVLDVSEMHDDEARAFPDERVIHIRTDTYLELLAGKLRPRFTICHELGHIALRHRLQGFGRTANDHAHGFFEDSEWQADTYAAELLSPPDLVRRYCRCNSDIETVFGMSRVAAENRNRNLRGEGLIDW